MSVGALGGTGDGKVQQWCNSDAGVRPSTLEGIVLHTGTETPLGVVLMASATSHLASGSSSM